MPLSKQIAIIVIKLGLLVWGVASLLQGAGLSFFVFGRSPYMQTFFFDLVYGSLFAVFLISMLSDWIAGLVSGIAAMLALAILLSTHSSGSGRDIVANYSIAIALRPALASLILISISRWENEPSLGTKFRLIRQGKTW